MITYNKKDIPEHLQKYFKPAELGLEKTPEEYVSKMVEIFREVKRVLKKEGTCWLNLGDTYSAARWSSGEGQPMNKMRDTHRAGKYTEERESNLPSKNLVGIPWRVAFALQQPYEEHLIKSAEDRAYVAGLVDGEGCITIQKTKSSHCESYSFPPIVQIRMCDTEAIDYFAGLLGVNRSEAELYNSSKEANQRPSYNVKATSEKAMNLIADIYPYLKVKRKQAIVAYNHQLFRNNTNYQPRPKEQIEREEFCKSLINKLNQREIAEIPNWMIEPKVKKEQGWFLRQDLIWHKPNPMPESVTDRCTKSHEYIFLLAKSPKYYFDSESIKEKTVTNDNILRDRDNTKLNNVIGRTKMKGLVKNNYEVRNKRSVWTITTKPFREAHFATFPEDLIIPMVNAGCPEKGIVLDPFMGAGTTGVVCKKLDRNYVGIDLNKNYCEMAKKRIDSVPQHLI